MSFYDSKPVYFISNACKSVQWIKKARNLWHKEKGKKVEVPFYRLSTVDEYNFGMGDVYQADKLLLQYRIQYWLRTQKWWFAIFLWIFECSLTNSYVLYRKFNDKHGRRMPQNHYEFIQDISLAWLKPSQYWPKKKSIRGSDQSFSDSSTVSESVVTRRCKLPPKQSDKFTEKSLNPYSLAPDTEVVVCYIFVDIRVLYQKLLCIVPQIS